MPKNASQNADGFRFYPWEGGDTELNRKYNATEKSDLLSVTSIKTLAGIAFQIVNWQISNVLNLAMGTRRVTVIGPRGGVSEKLVKDGPFPGEFVSRMMKSDGTNLDETRKWLRSTADHPRDVAAVRGSVVHKLIELNVPLDLVDEVLVRRYMDLQWKEEKVKVKPDVLEDDVNFVTNAMAQYHDMRAKVPFVVIAQEPQIYNLTAGYGGSGDVILWFLGRFEQHGDEVIFVPLPDADKLMVPMQKAASKKTLTLAQIETVGGTLAVGDWKTSKGVYTSHIVQTVAYMAGEFIALDGIIDERMSDILTATALGMVIHIRPNAWMVGVFEFRQDVLRAFLGSLAYARFLALHKRPEPLFIYSMSASAEGTGESEVVDDDGE
jgi:hypothetical protein